MKNSCKKESFRVKTVFCVLPALIWTGIIVSFSLQPANVSSDTSLGFLKKIVDMFLPWFSDNLEMLSGGELDMLNTIIRKGAHFTEFMILGILTMLAVKYTVNVNWRNKGLVSIVYCVLVAAADETVQLFVAGRAGRVADVLLDSIGAAAGVGIFQLFSCLGVVRISGK